MRGRPTPWWKAAVIMSVPLMSGCVAYQLVSPLLPLQASQNSEQVFQTVVLGIDSPSDAAQSYELGKFVDDLNKAGLFKAVQYRNKSIARSDLILGSFSYRETNPYQACPLGFAGQILTIGTVGLVPQICKSNNEISFVLYSPRDEQQKKTVSFAYQTQSIMGWVALLYTPSSAWKSMPSKNERADLVKAVFFHEAADIQRILRPHS
jgi:hypothetical protein